MKSLKLIKLFKGRYVFIQNVKRLNVITKEELKGKEFFTLNNL